MNDAVNDLQPPPESAMLKAAQKKSGLTVADLAVGTGLSVGTIQNALNGVRYRDGKPRVAVPPDSTLVRLSSVLRIQPEVLRAYGRDRAADLLAEALREGDGRTTAFQSDQEAQAVVAGRRALARQILAAFSAEELRAELDRRDRAAQDEIEREVHQDLADEWRATRL